jgi:hypothetical protein
MWIKTDPGGKLHAVPNTEAVFLCPFCGSEEIELKDNGTAKYWVECFRCRARGPGRRYRDSESEKDHLLAANSAIEAWNRRASRAQNNRIQLRPG